MAFVLYDYPHRLIAPDGLAFRAYACGRLNEQDLWEGWIEYVAEDGSRALCTPAEAQHHDLVDLDYWASGVALAYLEAALLRAQAALALPLPEAPSRGQPMFPAPAPSRERTIGPSRTVHKATN